MQRIIVGLSGASGAIYGIRLLEILKAQPDIETHLVISKAARKTIALETNYSLNSLLELADQHYHIDDIAAAIASGSFRTNGMIILPCSIKTLSGIANSYTDDLLTRAADVVIKERKPLILGIRETPLHTGHLKLMLRAAEIGAVIMPPVPAFYHRPNTLDDLINQTINRILDQLNISLDDELFTRWGGRS